METETDIMIKNEDKITTEFFNLIENLTDEQYQKWVFSWIDYDMINDIYKNWDLDIMENEIDNLKVLKGGNNE